MPRRDYKKIFLCARSGVMISMIARRVALRYARLLSRKEFDKLMEWFGPKAMAAHRKFPSGHREFDTRTRVMTYNIAPDDYLKVDVDKAKAMMSEGAQLMDVVNPEAYRAMKDVLEALRKRHIKFKMVNVSWAQGGSYIEAVLPKPQAKEPQQQTLPGPGEVDPRTWI
jgi:hypothetical protein